MKRTRFFEDRSMALAGRWSGYWEAKGWGRRPMRLTLRLDEGRIDGEGDDCIGAFTFVGTYDESGRVSMVKQYIGQHHLLYEGTYDVEGTIFGQWSQGPTWTGPFALKFEKAADSSQEAGQLLSAEFATPDR
jgi:hypothetical protein